MTYIAVTALSHPGAVRDTHEDSLVAGPWTLCAAVTQSPQTLSFPVGVPLVVAVADGLGGHPAGEVASAVVVRQLAKLGPSLDAGEYIADAVARCNEAVHAAGRTPARRGMASTVAGLVLTPEQVLVFNVGDSRVYQAAPGGLRQLSTDDRLPDAPSNVVTQTLGGLGGIVEVDPHLVDLPAEEGASFLICSDGLTDAVGDDLLEELLAGPDGGPVVFELWQAAIEAGGPDNITIALVRVLPDPED